MLIYFSVHLATLKDVVTSSSPDFFTMTANSEQGVVVNLTGVYGSSGILSQGDPLPAGGLCVHREPQRIKR
jgi:hypothetical protein